MTKVLSYKRIFAAYLWKSVAALRQISCHGRNHLLSRILFAANTAFLCYHNYSENSPSGWKFSTNLLFAASKCYMLTTWQCMDSHSSSFSKWLNDYQLSYLALNYSLLQLVYFSRLNAASPSSWERFSMHQNLPLTFFFYSYRQILIIVRPRNKKYDKSPTFSITVLCT